MAKKTSAKINRPRSRTKPIGAITRKLPVNRRPYYGDKPGAMVTFEHIPEPMFKAALVKCGGIRASAARALGLTRSAVTKRIKHNPHLLAFVLEIEAHVGDMVEGNIVELCEEKDGAMLRFYADRKLRDRGYGLKFDFKDNTPIDPLAEQKRAEAMKLVGAMIEERARLGLPPLFAKAGPAPVTIEGAVSQPKKPVELDPVLPKKPNGKGGNGHG